MAMNAPVQMVCIRCGAVILKGTPIERLKVKGTRYAHVGCSRGNPPKSQPGDSKAGPKIPPPGADAPKGWVTEDKFSLPEDAIKRLRGQDAPDGGTDRPITDIEHDERVDDPEDVRARKGEDGEGDTDGDGIPDLFDDIDGPESDGKEAGGTEGEDGDGEADGDDDGEEGEEGDDEEDGDGSERKDGDEGEEGKDTDGGEEEDDDGPDGDTGEKEGEKDQSDQSGEKDKKKKPPAKPKERNGKLEDLPDDLLLKLAMLAAQMATEKLKGTIEPRLSRILAEVAEPLTAKMAGEFQRKMGDSVRDQLTKAIADTRKDATGTIETLRKEIDRRVEEEIKRLDGLRPVIHKIEGPENWEKVFPESELFHYAFDETLKLCGAGFDVFTPGPTGCISGDMWLRYVVRKDGKLVNKKGGRFDTLYHRFHGHDPKPGKPRGIDGCEYFIQSVNDEGYVFLNRITNVVDSGIKEVFWITTESGNQVKATADHPFMTESGYTPLSHLKVGDVIYSVPRTAQATGRAKQPYRKEVFVKYHPTAAKKIVNGSTYYRVREYQAVIEAHRSGMKYDAYIELLNAVKDEADAAAVNNVVWTIPPGYDVHHIDENCQNNALENLALIPSSEHDRLHSTGVKIYAEEDRIVSIEPAGEEQVYDLVVADPYRNFVVEDIVVHNCGKTHMFGQIAQALGLDFGLISGTGGVTETEIFGNSTPNISTGEQVYQETEFVRLYENGGLFLLDEADAMDANCLLKVNAAIANGYCTIPKRLKKPRAKRHPKFIFGLAANTWGHGATRLYCGRNKLDEATLDRFRGGTVPMDYDTNIERRLVGDQKLYRTLAGWRGKIMEHGIPRVLSTRFMVQSVKLQAMGYDLDGIAKKLTGGWTPGEVEKVIGRKLA